MALILTLILQSEISRFLIIESFLILELLMDDSPIKNLHSTTNH